MFEPLRHLYKPNRKPRMTEQKIISQPSEEEFKLGEREKRLLQNLSDWQERSSKIHWVLGEPLE